MSTTPPLPAYTDETLVALSSEELLELLTCDEDRVPRNLIDECVHRGDAFVPYLDHMLQHHPWQDDTSDEAWWRLLHAAMILGGMPTEAAGLLLASHMRAMSVHDDENLQEWLSSDWPALFRNKPPGVLAQVRAIVEDRSLKWYARSNAIDAMLAMEQQCGAAEFEEALDRLASMAQDKSDDHDFRLFSANALLDFPQPRHRALLEALAKQQSGQKFGAVFLMSDVADAYAAAQDPPRSQLHRKDPWQFYDPQAITQRQERWAKENREALERQARLNSEQEQGGDDYSNDGDGDYGHTETYVRPTPKIGRNDPCPCGSGKKYKKCCLPLDQAG